MRLLSVLALLLATSNVPAQPVSPLPQTLSGRWTASGVQGVFSESFSLTFEGSREAGTVPGRLTWRGINCGAKDEPIQAQWDGTVLRFAAVLKADTNTQRSYGKCGTEPMRLVMKRKSDNSFEGDGQFANITVTVTASP